jgi:chemotaxis protein CheX
MKVEYINPFIESVDEMFTMMLSSSATRGDIGVSKEVDTNPREIMALIGLSGHAKGMVSMAFPLSTALHMVNQLLGTETKSFDDSVADAVAEMVNIVAGGAKAKFKLEEGQTPLKLSLPTVVRGKSYDIQYPKNTVWIAVPFESEFGPFQMQVTFSFDEPEGTANGAAQAASATSV